MPAASRFDSVVNSYETGGRAAALARQRQFVQTFRVIDPFILMV
jgi:hypothetical protein